MNSLRKSSICAMRKTKIEKSKSLSFILLIISSNCEKSLVIVLILPLDGTDIFRLSWKPGSSNDFSKEVLVIDTHQKVSLINFCFWLLNLPILLLNSLLVNSVRFDFSGYVYLKQSYVSRNVQQLIRDI